MDEIDPISKFFFEKYYKLKDIDPIAAKSFLDEIYETKDISLEDVQIIFNKHKPQILSS